MSTDSPRPLLIDTDPGIDDALALLVAWGSPEIAVEVVTTVAGNVPVASGTTNVFRLLALRAPTPLPTVAVGAERPLARPLRTATHHHGADGLGDLPDWPPVAVRPAPATAATLMARTARWRAGGLTLVALGPLTNVALALEADPPALAGLSRLVIMGGAVDAPGNVTPTAEFNAHVDPDAAARVFAADLPIDLVPLDATRQATLTREELAGALAARPGPVAERVTAFTRRAFEAEPSGLHLHDPLAVGVAIDPTFVTWERVRIQIGPDGETRRVPGTANCRVARRVDRSRFVAAFLERLCPGSS